LEKLLKDEQEHEVDGVLIKPSLNDGNTTR